MEKKNKVDGISLAIVIVNVAIVAVLITLVVLIYLYLTGNLEQTNVSEMEQADQTAASIVTTVLTTDTVETTTVPSEETEESETTVVPGEENSDPEETDESESDTITAMEEDDYDPDFFKDDMFIGDSIYTGIVNYGYFSATNVFAKIGLNPESVFTVTDDNGETALSRAKKLQPKRIFIMLGSNGLAFMSNTYMAEKIGELVDTLNENCPESYIYVVSIPPVTKAHEAAGQETMVMVNGYNKLLKSMCEDKNIVYLDLCGKMEDSTGYFSADYAEADGLHFLPAGYVRMFSFFQKSIQL